jgi:hypothetical protein
VSARLGLEVGGRVLVWTRVLVRARKIACCLARAGASSVRQQAAVKRRCALPSPPLAAHGEGLAAAGLPIGQDGCIIAIQGGIQQLGDAAQA